MAGDWIRMRASLVTNPKVIRMARLLAKNRSFMEWWTRGTQTRCDETVYEICDVTIVTRVTIGSLLPVWAQVNECASGDGFMNGATLFEVDEMAGVPGFGAAMAAVGWVEEVDGGLRFPSFHEHNSVAKQRSSLAKSGSERTKEWRDRKAKAAVEGVVTGDVTRDVTVTSLVDHREEKRREEKNNSKKPSQPPDGFDEFWDLYPKKIDKPAAMRAFAKIAAKAHPDLMNLLGQCTDSDQWRKQGGQFVPNPATWLNRRDWENSQTTSFDDDPMMGAR